MSTLLPFHQKILEAVHDPATNDLLVIARGLGLRRIICTLLKIYDSPKNLVLILNANSEEESEIGEELGMMGCRKPGLRVVAYETGNKDRQALYKGGGLISVTSRILVVDMLKGDIPVDMITGVLVLHAEKVTALALEAFIVRLYREKNRKGFLKAFTDQPEHITSGMSPLKNIMKELQLRTVHIYPRFHDDIKKSLERRKADVIELSQDMSENMVDIHSAIIECMNGTLYELKRSNMSLELDDLNIENAYFRSFEIIVRKQLDSVWHKVGPKTKQLVNDLGTLRLLLYFLLTYDPLQFHAYIETLVTSNNTSQYGGPKQHHPPWMMTDAADMIFRLAKRRCYALSTPKAVEPTLAQFDLNDDDFEVAGWDALDDVQGRGTSIKQRPPENLRPKWLPRGLDPILEEHPKWSLLADVLQEVEGEILRQELERAGGSVGMIPPSLGSDTVLVMTSSTRACNTVTEFLSTMDYAAPRGTQGRAMMMRKLKLYLWWKGRLSQQASNQSVNANQPAQKKSSSSAQQPQNASDALKKDRGAPQRGQTRRRVRGGAPTPTEGDKGPGQAKKQKNDTGDVMVDEIRDEADTFADFWAAQGNSAGGNLGSNSVNNASNPDILEFVPDLEEFDTNYGLLEPQQTVIVRAYSNDLDDRMLAEIQPRFIVMFEPSMEFVRRVEVYRSSNPGLGVRVYHMIYTNSCEEHKYLAAIRREKYAFEKLIKERATMLLPILEDNRAGSSEVIKTISSRIAGGRRETSSQPSQVVVDMREFRSTLPSLLHASSILIIPATLTVGDYILTPEICVERKSLSDLVSSFNSGRLYTQCEMMSVHYKNPVLLIEFEEDKAFNLEIVSDLKSYAKPTGKYPAKKRGTNPTVDDYIPSIQSKLVLLLLSFPRVRVIWSSSPYATTEIFNDLKLNQTEPDPVKAVSIGAEEDPDAGAGVNSAAEELLRCLPGINTKNVKYVMSKVGSIRELCEMALERVQEILGVEPGKQCWEFLHTGEDSRRR